MASVAPLTYVELQRALRRLGVKHIRHAWKEDYPAYFELVFPQLRVGGLIAADNITHPVPPGEGIETYLHKARSRPDAQSQLIAIGKGLELTVRLS